MAIAWAGRLLLAYSHGSLWDRCPVWVRKKRGAAYFQGCTRSEARGDGLMGCSGYGFLSRRCIWEKKRRRLMVQIGLAKLLPQGRTIQKPASAADLDDDGGKQVAAAEEMGSVDYSVHRFLMIRSGEAGGCPQMQPLYENVERHGLLLMMRPRSAMGKKDPGNRTA